MIKEKRSCEFCGTEFETTINSKKTCNKQCSDKLVTWNQFLRKNSTNLQKSTKEEIFSKILNTAGFLAATVNFCKAWNIYDRFLEIFGNEENYKNLTRKEKSKKVYDYFVPFKGCVICGKPTVYMNNFKLGYRSTCSDECFSKEMTRLQTGNNNSAKNMSEETKKRVACQNSIRMKERIEKGEWTPCITNSWANSRVKIKIKQCNYAFRSTWECLFWISNQHLLYEKVRIRYYDSIKEKERIYIVDFVDEENKVLYEMKPMSNQSNQNTLDKASAAKNFCEIKGYEYKFVDQNDLFLLVDSLIKNPIVKGTPKLLESIKRLQVLQKKDK